MISKSIKELIFVNRNTVCSGNIVTYYIKSKTDLFDAANAIALGQSVGNSPLP